MRVIPFVGDYLRVKANKVIKPFNLVTKTETESRHRAWKRCIDYQHQGCWRDVSKFTAERCPYSEYYTQSAVSSARPSSDLQQVIKGSSSKRHTNSSLAWEARTPIRSSTHLQEAQLLTINLGIPSEPRW